MIRKSKGEIVMVPEHYELLRQRHGAKSYALLSAQFLARFPHDRDFLEGLTAQYQTSPAGPLRELLDLADLYPEAALRFAFQLAAEHNRYSHIFVRGVLENGAQPEVPEASLSAKATLPASTVSADLGRYQQVLELAR